MIVFDIMERSQETGESIAIAVMPASNPAEAKSKWHLETGIYDNNEKSYWAKAPQFLDRR